MSDPLFHERKHVVFDLETYSLRKNAMILSFGAAVFQWSTLETFEHYRDTGLLLKLDPSAQGKRHVDLATMDWWANEPCDAARDASLADNPVGIAPKYFFQALDAWARMQKFDENTLWYCRGPHFDAAILEDFATDYGGELPFRYNRVRDVPSVLDFTQEGRLDYPDDMVPHHPLHDAAWDAYQMVYWSF